MSVLTKLFVLILTVLSIALSMLTIGTMASQQNWKQSAADYKGEAATAVAQLDAVTANAALEQQRALARLEDNQAEITRLRNEINEYRIQLANASQKIASTTNQLNNEQAQATSLAEHNKMLEGARSREQELVAKLSERNSRLTRENIDLNDRVKELTANMAMAQSRVRALKEQLSGGMGERFGSAATMQIPNANATVQAYTPSASAPIGLSDITAPIRGEVTAVRGDLAEISVGSADGVGHGMRFLLYRRTGGAPKYVGTLRVTAVEANAAAGVIEQSEGDISVGDAARDQASFAMGG
ncbi:MAG: hypothetical protein H6818_19610 [Phycisphaerales bacterium]|nr:hypothetical protein [Phycisphaerales bacterium]MCB9863674.1 hypothetical protein [Phycisphaerales bacterium]